MSKTYSSSSKIKSFLIPPSLPTSLPPSLPPSLLPPSHRSFSQLSIPLPMVHHPSSKNLHAWQGKAVGRDEVGHL